jgi:acyl-CoA synthetase (AMP-forming)/AMP-acid ligase II
MWAKSYARMPGCLQWTARSCRLAKLGKGDRVAVLAYNCVEWLEIYAATAKTGLVAVPVNFRLVGAEIACIVENCEAAAFIIDDAFVETLEQVSAEPSVPAQNFIFTSALAGHRASLGVGWLVDPPDGVFHLLFFATFPGALCSGS